MLLHVPGPNPQDHFQHPSWVDCGPFDRATHPFERSEDQHDPPCASVLIVTDHHALRRFFEWVAAAVFHLGGVGVLIVGIVDSSFLTVPVANDLLVIALSSAHPYRMPYYAFMAALGSVIGCATVDVITRKTEEGIEHVFSGPRIKFVERQVRKRAGWALAVSAIMPPPFPFTPVVVAAAASHYPQKKLFAVIGGARFLRFAGEGALAIWFGGQILSVVKSPAVEYTIIAFIIIAVGGSAFSILRWAKKATGSKRSSHQPQKAS
jgi:hypothetical protein